MNTSDILIDAFGRVHDIVHRVCEGLDADGLAYRPDDEANSIGWLVWHLTRVEDDHVSEIAGREQLWLEWAPRLGMQPDPSDTGFGHTPEQVAAVRPAGIEPLLGYQDATHDMVVASLAGVDAGELDRIIDRRWDPPVTVGVRLVSVIGDTLQHCGQAAYVKGLLERLKG